MLERPLGGGAELPINFPWRITSQLEALLHLGDVFAGVSKSEFRYNGKSPGMAKTGCPEISARNIPGSTFSPRFMFDFTNTAAESSCESAGRTAIVSQFSTAPVRVTVSASPLATRSGHCERLQR